MNFKTIRKIFIGCLALPATALAAPNPSAETGLYVEMETVYARMPSMNFTTRMYANDKSNSRIETQDVRGQRRVLINHGKMSWVLDAAHKIALPMSVDQTILADTPCRGQGNAVCKVLGHDVVLGRRTVKYDVMERRVNLSWNESRVSDRHSIQWIDAQTGIPSAMRAASIVLALMGRSRS